MIDVGILGENDRVELIRGVIVAKMPIGDPHVTTVNRLNRVFNRLTDDTIIVSIQNPIRLADSEPEPDVVLMKARDGKPSPADTVLVIEVADDSLENDREVKGPLYAENGIVEYWIVNLIDKCVEVYRQPRADGTYDEVRTLRGGETTDIISIPGITLNVADLIGS